MLERLRNKSAVGLAVGAAIAALLVLGYVEALTSAGSSNGHRFGRLVDQRGVILADQPASHGYKLMAFGFTQCPDVCPLTLRRVHQVLDALGPDAGLVAPLFVTLDPAHDSPEALAQYTAEFDPRIVGVTGDPRELRAFASTYGAYPQGDGPPDMAEVIGHTSKIYLLGRDNEILAAYLLTLSPDAIASDVLAQQRRDQSRRSGG